MIAASHIYYFDIAQGSWRGRFRFAITNYRAFAADHIPLSTKALALSFHVLQKFTGRARMTARMEGDPHAGTFGVIHAFVEIRKLGVRLYRMQGEYSLDPDGVRVAIRIDESFGPLARALGHEKTGTARIGTSGTESTYDLPLFGRKWVGHYVVSHDRNHLQASYQCPWGFAVESMNRDAAMTRQPGGRPWAASD